MGMPSLDRIKSVSSGDWRLATSQRSFKVFTNFDLVLPVLLVHSK